MFFITSYQPTFWYPTSFTNDGACVEAVVIKDESRSFLQVISEVVEDCFSLGWFRPLLWLTFVRVKCLLEPGAMSNRIWFCIDRQVSRETNHWGRPHSSMAVSTETIYGHVPKSFKCVHLLHVTIPTLVLNSKDYLSIFKLSFFLFAKSIDPHLSTKVCYPINLWKYVEPFMVRFQSLTLLQPCSTFMAFNFSQTPSHTRIVAVYSCSLDPLLLKLGRIIFT